MSIASLFNIPQNEQGFLLFSFNNMDAHRRIVNGIFARNGVLLPLYDLDPIPPSDPQTWLQTHQAAHVAFTDALGIAGVDLTAVDFNDPEQAASWMRLHGEEHRQAANILGFG